LIDIYLYFQSVPNSATGRFLAMPVILDYWRWGGRYIFINRSHLDQPIKPWFKLIQWF